MKTLFVLLFSLLYLHATQLASPEEAMQNNFKGAVISKENLLLSQQEAQEVEKYAKKRLPSKIVRLFYAKTEDQLVGIGILLSQKVRSQNGVTLYMFDTSHKLQSIEIVAFHEPLEYLPNQAWKEQFKGKSTQDSFMVGEDIAFITGATLSARSITDAARLAFGVYTILRRR